MDGPTDRGISEAASTLTLVAVTILVVGAVGANVLFAETDGGDGPEATFTYDYFGEQQQLIIEHNTGEAIPAGQLLISGPRSEATWAETNAQVDNSTLIGPGNVTQIGSANAFNRPVGSGDRIEIRYLNRTAGTSTVLDTWNGSG